MLMENYAGHKMGIGAIFGISKKIRWPWEASDHVEQPEDYQDYDERLHPPTLSLASRRALNKDSIIGRFFWSGAGRNSL